MMRRYEKKLRENCKRGRRHYGFHGRKMNRRKVKRIRREWQYWASKHNRLAIGIRRVTGFWWMMPNECNTI